MSSGNMRLTLSLSARDEGASRLIQRTQKELELINRRKAELANKSRPYALLNIRSEKEIQREITRTQAAYRALAQRGTASQNDLARAAAATKNRIAQLNAELKQGIQTQSRFAGAMGKIRQWGTAAVAGGTAAYAVVSPTMEQYKNLDMRLRETTWAAHGETQGKDTQWMETKGLPEVRALIRDLVEKNGGHHDVAIDTVQGMLANGMTFEQVKRDAHATHNLALAAGENGQYDGAAAAKLAQVFANNGFDVARASQMAAQSGMQGTFEIADMVRELPSLLPDAKAAGFTGEAGLAMLLSMLQSASNKAGSTSEAANNIKNALQKTLSADTTKRMDRLLQERGSGQDWQKMVLEGQREGKNAMQVLGDFAQKLLSEDKDFQAAKARADKGDEAAKQEMATMQAFMISRLLPDMQARAGLNAMIDHAQISQYYNELLGNQSNTIGDKNAFMGNGAAARQERAASLRDLALQESQTFENLVEAETQFKSLAAEFPVATEALKALAAAATAAAVAQGAMSLLGKGGGLGSRLTGAAGSLGRGGAIGSRLFAGGTGAAGSGAMLAAAAPLGVMYGVTKWAEKPDKSAETQALVGLSEKLDRGMRSLFGWAGYETQQEKHLRRRAEQLQETSPRDAAAYRQQYAQLQAVLDGKTLHAASSPPEQTAAYQTALNEQTASFQAALQADTAAVGGKLDTINGTLGGLNQTIQNNMTVHLDGRVIASEVSRHQVAMFGRGAGQ
ncbi:MAG: phage tail tape measure protein [Alysiella sp.]|uniref:phage tail tape measure protein n=1 Tax=Alysiella sp. TaxID=1872483 RepID=UPI0026DBF901|nr:phage tail tape measure protein [Alysiella sp.]MDO4434386.1 phage tail tape measure protein [Alysiella sp.]